MTLRRPDVPAAIALAAAMALGIVGWERGTWAAGGSDSSCYALMADAFAGGALQPTTSLADAPWPNPPLTLAPAGFVPSPVRRGAASPICAPGFSALLAPLVAAFGWRGVFILTPIAGAALVWVVFLLARRLAGAWAGAMAAVLVATSPIVLFQVVQPMNDIAVTALWLGAIAALVEPSRGTAVRNSRDEFSWGQLTLAGALAGAALLVRPNLLPVGIVVTGWVIASGRAGSLAAPWQAGAIAAARFAIAVAPFGLLVLWFNHVLYGSPLRSGYGSAADLFAWSHIPVNAANHLRAIVETQAAVPLIGLLAPPLLSRGRREAWLAWLAAITTVICYLPYQPFPEWWYLRFLMPAVALLTALASALIVDRLSRPTAGQAFASVTLALATIALAAFGLRAAGERQAFDLWRLESRFRHAAEAMLDHLPPSTVAISVFESGSVRFHARREAVLWDSLDPAWLDRAVAWLLARGIPAVVVIERWEEPLFRARFGARSVIGALDWPPRIDVDGVVRIYDPADRVRHLAGQRVETTIVAPRD